MPPALATILLLIAANAFMAYAWYGHLHDGRKDAALWLAIATSWLIALPEYGGTPAAEGSRGGDDWRRAGSSCDS